MSPVRAAMFTLAFLATGCEYDGDFLFNDPIDGVPAVLDLKAEDGAAFDPVDITSPEDAAANTVYAEIGPNTEALPSGVTVEFIGNGQDVCVFVDPELVHWNASVSQASPNQTFRFPDNVYDDGDLDILVGQSVYYRGTPGERMGGFEVQYSDELGNDLQVDLVACRNATSNNEEAHSGRGTPEYCTIRNTLPGVSYTVAMEAFSLPRDDGRMSFGVLVANGECTGSPESLISVAAPGSLSDLPVNEECLIRGEALPPLEEGAGAHLYYGYAEGRSYEGSEAFEDAFCDEGVFDYCREEISAMRAEGLLCDYNGSEKNIDLRCFCGDRSETPSPGAQR